MNEDQLYAWLPAVYRQRDAEHGGPLRALLRVIAEQVNLVESDIAQLYENWFIETCADWVVPYLGDLVGYQSGPTTSDPDTRSATPPPERARILVPRREIANLIRYRRRKGTLSLLEQLIGDVAGWPALVLESYARLAQTQSLNQLHLERGRTLDLRQGAELDRLSGPFSAAARTVDVRGPHNLPDLAAMIWRLQVYSVTRTSANCLEEVGSQCFTFSVLGNDSQLYTRAEPEADPGEAAAAINLPLPLGRRALEQDLRQFYGADKSFFIWVGVQKSARVVLQPIAPEQIVVADLSDWSYRPRRRRVAVDPVLGRILFHPSQTLAGVWVSYHYGFSADIGGGEYTRPLSGPPGVFSFSAADFNAAASLAQALRAAQSPLDRYIHDKLAPATLQLLEDEPDQEEISAPLLSALIADLNRLLLDARLYHAQRFAPGLLSSEIRWLLAQNPADQALSRLNRLLLEAAYPQAIASHFQLYLVGEPPADAEQPYFAGIEQALAEWQRDQPRQAIVEITDSGVYTEQINIVLRRGQSLQLRAAQRTRPVINLLDRHKNRPDSLTVSSESGGCLTLDGLLIAGRSMRVEGQVSAVTIRHCTLVPGWGLYPDCRPRQPAKPSLELFNTAAHVAIEHSILGSIQVYNDEVRQDQSVLQLSDSILDATSLEREALGAPNWPLAHVRLTLVRCTVFGQVLAHAIELAEDTILTGLVSVARRQIGCMRFCFVPAGSRTPRRYSCQPDLVEQSIEARIAAGTLAAELRESARELERQRVEPQFNSERYGTPTYCQLAAGCAPEISQGASDEAEMGVFHDLYQPQRAATLRARLDEYTPAGMTMRIIYGS